MTKLETDKIIRVLARFISETCIFHTLYQSLNIWSYNATCRVVTLRNLVTLRKEGRNLGYNWSTPDKWEVTLGSCDHVHKRSVSYFTPRSLVFSCMKNYLLWNHTLGCRCRHVFVWYQRKYNILLKIESIKWSEFKTYGYESALLVPGLKSLVIYRTHRFIAGFAKRLHWIRSWAWPVEFTSSHSSALNLIACA
jgi:hypothetical protein